MTGSGANYTVTVSGMTDSGTVTVSVAAGTAQDANGDESLASNEVVDQFNYFDQQGSTLTIIGEGENNPFVIDFTDATHFVVTLNGYSQSYSQSYSTSQVSTINCSGNTYTEIYGAGAVQAHFYPAAVQVTGAGYSINVTGSIGNYVYANAGSTAEFTGAALQSESVPNSFVATLPYSYMTGTYAVNMPPLNGIMSESFTAYSNFAVGFGNVYAYAYNTADSALLYSSHDAVVPMTPGYSYLSGGGAAAFADGFSNVYAYSAGDGSDSAYLYDSAPISTNAPGLTLTESASGVSFVGTPTYSYMSGQFSVGGIANFFNEAEGFANVYAIAQGSGDVAYLDSSSSSGSDLLAFADGAAGIRGYGYENVIQGFGLIYATVSTGAGANNLAVEGNTNDLPNLPGPVQSLPQTIDRSISYDDGNELIPVGFGNANLYLEASQVAALDFVLQQLGSWSTGVSDVNSAGTEPLNFE